MEAVNLINNLLSYFYIKKRIKFDFSNLKIIQYIKPMFLVVILSNTALLYTMFDRLMIDKYSSNNGSCSLWNSTKSNIYN